MNPIVGIGELLWDIYPDGRKVAGGAPFNFAFHCHQLGHNGVIVSRVGNDDLGRELREKVRRLGLSDKYIQTDHEHPTGTVQVKLNSAGVPTYTITENVAWDFIRNDIDSGFPRVVATICFGTLALRQAITRATIFHAIQYRSESSSLLRVLDVNFRSPYLPDDATLKQCVESADWIKISEDDIKVRTESLGVCLQAKPKVLIHTLGGDGCNFLTADGGHYEPAALANVIDTVGAGDAFTAAMVCLHLEGRSLRDCARFASHYAARVCEHAGATPRIDRAEIERAIFGR
jgi:fructokinase